MRDPQPPHPTPLQTAHDLLDSRLGALSGETCYAVETSRPDAVLGLAVPARLLLVNITSDTQRVVLGVKPKSIMLLTAAPPEAPATEMLELGAYGCAEIVLPGPYA